MRRILLAAALTMPAFFSVLKAQQEPQYTQYTWNKLVFNPGYAGSRQGLCATLVYHNQWTNFTGPDKEGAPITQSFAIHGPITIKGHYNLGLGLHVVNDAEGFIGTTGFVASAAFRKKLNFGELGVGLNAGMFNKTINPQWRAKDQLDPRLPGQTSGTTPDVGLGAYLNTLNWYVGVSALHLNAGKLKWKTDPRFGGQGTVDMPMARTFFLVAGYNYAITGTKFELQPSVLIKKDEARTEADATIIGMYNQRLWAGLNYRAAKLSSLSAMVGAYILPNLALGYSYDIATKNAPIFGGTHEIMLNYCFRLQTSTIEPVFHKSPRYL